MLSNLKKAATIFFHPEHIQELADSNPLNRAILEAAIVSGILNFFLTFIYTRSGFLVNLSNLFFFTDGLSTSSILAYLIGVVVSFVIALISTVPKFILSYIFIYISFLIVRLILTSMFKWDPYEVERYFKGLLYTGIGVNLWFMGLYFLIALISLIPVVGGILGILAVALVGVFGLLMLIGVIVAWIKSDNPERNWSSSKLWAVFFTMLVIGLIITLLSCLVVGCLCSILNVVVWKGMWQVFRELYTP